jgi:hypothetical protein
MSTRFVLIDELRNVRAVKRRDLPHPRFIVQGWEMSFTQKQPGPLGPVTVTLNVRIASKITLTEAERMKISTEVWEVITAQNRPFQGH